MGHNRLAEDLEAILERGASLWPSLKGARFFITGGTGFIGTWFLESLVWLNEHLDLGMQAVVLTRDSAAFERKAPHIARHAGITLLVGDVRNFEFPQGKFSIVIHGATDASAKLNAEDPLRMFDTIVEGTRRTLDFAVQAGAGKISLSQLGSGIRGAACTYSALVRTGLQRARLFQYGLCLCRRQTCRRIVMCFIRQTTWSGDQAGTMFCLCRAAFAAG